jgi:hypothetical protein
VPQAEFHTHNCNHVSMLDTMRQAERRPVALPAGWSVGGTQIKIDAYFGGTAVGLGFAGAGAALGADFFLTGFFTGAVSSTTIFAGG